MHIVQLLHFFVQTFSVYASPSQDVRHQTFLAACSQSRRVSNNGKGPLKKVDKINRRHTLTGLRAA